MNGGKLLQTSHAPEAGHGTFSSSERLMRILGTIVQSATSHLPVGIADFLHRGAIGAELVGHDMFGPAVVFH